MRCGYRCGHCRGELGVWLRCGHCWGVVIGVVIAGVSWGVVIAGVSWGVVIGVVISGVSWGCDYRCGHCRGELGVWLSPDTLRFFYPNAFLYDRLRKLVLPQA